MPTLSSPRLCALLAPLLSAADASRAWDAALAALAQLGIVEHDVERGPAWLRVKEGTREVSLALVGDVAQTDALREALEPLLQIGLRRLLDQEQLKTTRERMDMLSAASFEGLIFHVEGTVIDLNQRLCEMLGYSREELLHPDAFARVVAAEDQEAVLRRMAERYEGDYMVTGIRKDGSRFPAELSAKQGTLGDHPVRVAAVRDVSERERTFALLRESEQRLGELASATFDMTVLSRDEIVLDVIGPLDRLLGYTRAEAIGRRVFDFIAPAAVPLVKQVLGDRRVGNYESVLLAKSGELVPVEVVAVMSTLNGEPVRVGAVRDLREARRQESERQLLEQQIERSQRLESLGVLAGGIAHDFNNLLVGILGNAELLLERLTDERDRAAAQGVLAAAERAATLTAQMLAYAGRGELGPRRAIDMALLVQELRSLLDATLSKKAQLELALAEHCVVHGDRATLSQVFMNLLTNASDALGDEVGTISVKVERVTEPERRWQEAQGRPIGPGNWVLVEVRDTGIGMSQATRERVFEPFFTTKVTGHGLGLAACVGIVSSHGGAILVESEHGSGSCFSVLLPATQLEAAPRPTVKSEPPTHVRTVLVIDDQPAVRTYVRRALERLGYRSEEAANGQAGLERLKRAGIDIVVLDMTMPDLSGLEVLTRLRAAGCQVPVVLSSGYHDLVSDLDSDTFQGFLIKPFSISQLALALERAL